MLSFGMEDTERAWAEMDLLDLRTCAARGDTLAEIATFLVRTQDEVLKKAQELELKLPN
jgi:hypothetical protein